MSTNLPKSRNRNLPPPPVEPAAVRHRFREPVSLPEAAHKTERRGLGEPLPELREPGRGATALRSFITMLLVGGLLFAGIFFYIRSSDSDAKKKEQVSGELQALGRLIWEARGFTTLPAETEDRGKDLADLPRIFAAAHADALKRQEVPRIVVLEGDPPPGRGNASHQIHYFFSDVVKIILRVYYDPKDGGIQFIGVNNRFVDSREVMEDEGRKSAEAKPSAPEPATTPPPAAPPPAEKVSELPVIPPQ